MEILHILLILIIIGVALWLVETYIPMDAAIKVVFRVVVVLFLVIWLLSLFGIGSGMYIGSHR